MSGNLLQFTVEGLYLACLAYCIALYGLFESSLVFLRDWADNCLGWGGGREGAGLGDEEVGAFEMDRGQQGCVVS